MQRFFNIPNTLDQPKEIEAGAVLVSLISSAPHSHTQSDIETIVTSSTHGVIYKDLHEVIHAQHGSFVITDDIEKIFETDNQVGTALVFMIKDENIRKILADNIW